MTSESDLDGLPVVPEPIRAWRFFRIRHLTLTSVSAHHSWRPDDREWHWALCGCVGGRTGQIPHFEGSCGFYAFPDLDEALRGLGPAPVDWVLVPEVIALVELAGRVVVHERGYRAQAMRIVEWWPIDDFVLGLTESRWPYLASEQERLRQGPYCPHCGRVQCWHASLCLQCRAPSSEGRCWKELLGRAPEIPLDVRTPATNDAQS